MEEGQRVDGGTRRHLPFRTCHMREEMGRSEAVKSLQRANVGIVIKYSGIGGGTSRVTGCIGWYSITTGERET